MAYVKTSWVARIGTALNRFLKTNEDTPVGTVELTNDPTGVTTGGTPFTVDNMNKIEDGIYDAHVTADYASNTADANRTLITTNTNQGVKTTDSPSFASINTGQGATEVHLMNQNLRTTDSPTFANLGQDVRVTASPHFANMNPPVDNNDTTPPAIGIGGFTYAVGNNVAVYAPAGGTYIFILANDLFKIVMGRVAGGTNISATSPSSANTYLIMRIA